MTPLQGLIAVLQGCGKAKGLAWGPPVHNDASQQPSNTPTQEMKQAQEMRQAQGMKQAHSP